MPNYVSLLEDIATKLWQAQNILTLTTESLGLESNCKKADETCAAICLLRRIELYLATFSTVGDLIGECNEMTEAAVDEILKASSKKGAQVA